MANNDPFKGPRLKLGRAYDHINDFKQALQQYTDREPACWIVTERPGTGKQGLLHSIREPIPDYLTLILGDAVHNARVALDILANELVRLNGNEPKGVYFPFAKTKDGLNNEIRRKMKWASGKALDIVRDLKPYPGGNNTLRAVHELDIADKHVSLLNFATAFPIPMRQVAPGQFQADFTQLPITRVVDPASLLNEPVPDDVRIVGKVQKPLQICINHNSNIGSMHVTEALNQITSAVGAVIGRFETAHLSGDI